MRLPGTGLSYRTIFGRPVALATLRKIAYAAIVGGALHWCVVYCSLDSEELSGVECDQLNGRRFVRG